MSETLIGFREIREASSFSHRAERLTDKECFYRNGSMRAEADRGRFEHSFKMLTVVILNIRLKC